MSILLLLIEHLIFCYLTKSRHSGQQIIVVIRKLPDVYENYNFVKNISVPSQAK